ncbi:hypothetical protein TRFO_26482 [Tritrichomonas foetus]|uniref:Uncharacterized protein n=1 Tax=Tritrichomonas foetus TaxID=1144522 RepID=A0A1J4K446_9EUKA|nr:hypothetical protein TRFO_26482 [Tritrichomonas foetus]|eukprot:OHT05738.1 hypothetical protein TRFO_26482 [Tritrichomonas foetus]
MPYLSQGRQISSQYHQLIHHYIHLIIKILIMTSLLKAVAGKATSAFNTIMGPKVVKTIDPRYKEASVNYKQVSIDTEQIIGSLIQMKTHLENLAKASVKLGEDINHWYADAPEDQQIKAKTTNSFTHNFSNLTVNFLGPRIDPHVVKILAKYQAEVVRLEKVKHERKAARREYDKAKSVVTFLITADDKNQLKMREADKKMKETKAVYDKLNEDFIQSVHKLVETRAETLETPFRNLIAIMSQYMMQIFSDMQKFRTTFPNCAFSAKTEDQAKAIKKDDKIDNEATENNETAENNVATENNEQNDN